MTVIIIAALHFQLFIPKFFFPLFFPIHPRKENKHWGLWQVMMKMQCILPPLPCLTEAITAWAPSAAPSKGSLDGEPGHHSENPNGKQPEGACDTFFIIRDTSFLKEPHLSTASFAIFFYSWQKLCKLHSLGKILRINFGPAFQSMLLCCLIRAFTG